MAAAYIKTLELVYSMQILKKKVNIQMIFKQLAFDPVHTDSCTCMQKISIGEYKGLWGFFVLTSHGTHGHEDIQSWYMRL